MFAFVALGSMQFNLAYAQRHDLNISKHSRPQLDLPRVTLKIHKHIINVQVASTAQQRQKGLMHRLHMPENEGMLFVFKNPAVQCFWMRNTQLSLTAAFIRADGEIVNLVDMQPLDEISHCAQARVLYVLEMNQGWFARKGIVNNTIVTLSNGKPLSSLAGLQKLNAPVQ